MTDIDAAARAVIAEVLARYCHAIDRRRWELMPGCFHDDAAYRFGPIDGSWRTFVTTAQAMIDPLPMTHHQLGQTVHAADGAALRCETYFTATHRVAADAAPDAAFDGRGHAYHAVMAGRYVDHFTCCDGCWRIARRVGVIDARHDIIPSGNASTVPGSADPGYALRLEGDPISSAVPAALS